MVEYKRHLSGLIRADDHLTICSQKVDRLKFEALLFTQNKMFPTKIVFCLLAISATIAAQKKGCNYVRSFRVPNNGNEYTIHGFTIDNTVRADGSDAADTAAFRASVNGEICAETEVAIDASTKTRKFNCPRGLIGQYVELVAKDQSLFICKLIVEGSRYCGQNKIYDDISRKCVCEYGSEDGQCRTSDPCGTNSRLGNDGRCICTNGVSVDGSTCIGETLECPANSDFNNGGCHCRGGYVLNGNTCQDPCGQYRRLVGGRCTCEIGVSVDGRSCVSGAHACPVNSILSRGRCLCTQGYAVLGNTCFDACGTNRRLVDGECTCATFGLDGRTCVGDCPVNSHRGNDNRCVCNAGFIHKGQSCQPKLETCDGLAYTYCRTRGNCHNDNYRHFSGDLLTCEEACSRDCRCKSIQTRRGYCWLIDDICPRMRGHNIYRSWSKHEYAKIGPGESCL